MQRSSDARCVRRQWIGNAARHRRQRRLMKYQLDAANGSLRRLDVDDIAFEDLDVLADVFEVRRIAGAEVVQHTNPMPPFEKRLDQVRSNETGPPVTRQTVILTPHFRLMIVDCRLTPADATSVEIDNRQSSSSIQSRLDDACLARLATRCRIARIDHERGVLQDKIEVIGRVIGDDQHTVLPAQYSGVSS